MDKYDALIKPKKHKNDPQIGHDAIISLIPSGLDQFMGLTDQKRIISFDMSTFRLYQIFHKETELSLSGPFIGAPHAAMGLEKIIALGAERIWVFGWAGSLSPALRTGDLFIPTWALSEEGTSGHYPINADSVQTDEYLNKAIENGLERREIEYIKGPVWTTDAPYRETLVKIKEYGNRGIIAVEMELAALLTVSLYRCVKLTGLLVISDELFDLRWKPGFSDPRLNKNCKIACEILLDTIGELQEY
jgi:uridine phosphorylase